MPNIVTGSLPDGTWIAAELDDYNRLKHVAYGATEQAARAACEALRDEHFQIHGPDEQSHPGWVPGSGGQV